MSNSIQEWIKVKTLAGCSKARWLLAARTEVIDYWDVGWIFRFEKGGVSGVWIGCDMWLPGPLELWLWLTSLIVKMRRPADVKTWDSTEKHLGRRGQEIWRREGRGVCVSVGSLQSVFTLNTTRCSQSSVRALCHRTQPVSADMRSGASEGSWRSYELEM